MNTRSEEPLVAIILKGLSILSALGAAIVYIAMFGHDVNPDARPQVIARAAAEMASKQIMAFTLTGSAITLWWMGEIIALLARIAANGARQAAVSQVAAASEPRPAAAPARRTADDDDDVPRYSL
jgi:hypothetical protein